MVWYQSLEYSLLNVNVILRPLSSFLKHHLVVNFHYPWSDPCFLTEINVYLHQVRLFSAHALENFRRCLYLLVFEPYTWVLAKSYLLDESIQEGIIGLKIHKCCPHMINHCGKFAQLILITNNYLELNVFWDLILINLKTLLFKIFIRKISSDKLSKVLINDCLKFISIDLLSTKAARIIDIVKTSHTKSMAAIKLDWLYHYIETYWTAAVYFQLEKLLLGVIDSRSVCRIRHL